jgi:3-deoxy-D-manno-octulosonic-acid transferase
MTFWLYNLLLILLAPVWIPWMFLRARRRQEPVDWSQRTGRPAIPPREGKQRIWIHAVSVGEVVAALPILRELKMQGPEYEIVLSVTTSSGWRTAHEKAREAGLVDHLIYFPIDVLRFCMASLTQVRPSAVAIMETELWMNFLRCCALLRLPTLVVNGRVSPRSFARSQSIRWFYKALLKDVGQALMQTQADADRLRALGHPSPEVLGSSKFDEAASAAASDRALLRSSIGASEGDVVLVIGSTRSELEEELTADALRRLLPERPNLRVVWAPRHLERADAVEQALSELGPVVRRSQGHAGRLMVLDTYGELSGIYAAGDVAVIGGGFDKLGGQNLIQPLAAGLPVVCGPHMENFQGPTQAGLEAGAVVQSSPDAGALADALAGLIDDASRRAEMGSSARALVKAQLGASAAYAARILAAAREYDSARPVKKAAR